MVVDAFRWVLLLEGFFVLGTLAALYQRVWRFALPALASRAVIVGGAATVAGYLIGVHDRLRSPLSWRDVLAGAALTLYLAALASLYVWYRMPTGRRQRHEAIASYDAWKLIRADERRRRRAEPD